MTLLTLFDYIGVFVFGLSGGLVAIRHKMDIFGVLVISLLPAIGGGTLRDLLLDVPVFWLNTPSIVMTAMLGGVAAMIYKYWTRMRLLVWVDALGLALFAILGAVKAASLGHGMVTCVMMGTITATAGGLLRDVVCNEPPLLLKEDIYATAALLGSGICIMMLKFGIAQEIAVLTGGAIVFITRGLAIRYKWSLPTSDAIEAKIYRKPKG